MRINLNYVNAYLVTELLNADAKIDITANGLDIITVRLASGEIVSIHLVERDIDVGLIKSILEENARAKVATVFILWCAMLLPDDGDLYRPYDWMLALLTLFNDKIYAYEGYGTNISVFPVHFDRQPIGLEYLIRYGGDVDMGKLGIDTIHAQTHHVAGIWRIADFAGPVRQQTHQQTQQQTQQSQTKRDSQGYTRARPDRNPMSAYYEILGISLGADVETIRQAYRTLARQYHPDVNNSPDATEHMQQINMAYMQIMARLNLDI